LKIYTKQGDAGKTVLLDGTRVEKDDLRIEMYGVVDELNSLIGLVIAECGDEKLHGVLGELQRQLLELGAGRVDAEAVTWMEGQIDAATAELPVLKRLIVPGGGVTASRLHVARTVCRRAERIMVRLMKEAGGLEAALVHMNRLSDLLFVLARLANLREGREDVQWTR